MPDISSSKTVAATLVIFLAFHAPDASALGHGVDPAANPPKTAYSQVVKDDAWQFSGKLAQRSGHSSGIQISPSWVMTAEHVITTGHQPQEATHWFESPFGVRLLSKNGCYWPQARIDVVLCRLSAPMYPPTGILFPPLVEDPRTLAPLQMPERYVSQFGSLMRVGFGAPAWQGRYAVVDAMGLPIDEPFPKNAASLVAPGPYSDGGDSGGPTFWYPPSQAGKGGVIGVQNGPSAVKLVGGQQAFSYALLQTMQSIVLQNSGGRETLDIRTAFDFFGGPLQLGPSRLDEVNFVPQTIFAPLASWNGVRNYPPEWYLVSFWNTTRNTWSSTSFVKHGAAGAVHTSMPSGLAVGDDYVMCVLPTGPHAAALGENIPPLGSAARLSAYDYARQCKAFLLSGPVAKANDLQITLETFASPSSPTGYFYRARTAWISPTPASSARTHIAGYRIYQKIGSEPETVRDEMEHNRPEFLGAIPGFNLRYCIAVAPITSPATIGPRSETVCKDIPAH